MSARAKPRSSPRPHGELDERIRQQVRILLGAAHRYDEGGDHARDEAITMAIRLRTLLHTTRASKAALDTAGYLNTMRFTDSVGIAPIDSPFIAVLKQEIDLRPDDGRPRVSFKPTFGYHLSKLTPGQQARLIMTAPAFVEWWSGVLVRDHDGREFTRRSIVITVANQDGGGHLDLDLPDDYLAVSRGHPTFGLSIRLDDGDDRYPDDPVPPLLRQITWEFERSLRQRVPALLPKAT